MPAFLQDGRRFTARRRSFTSRQINDEWLDEAASADGEATKRLRGASLFVYLGCAALLLTACAALGMWLLMERPVTCEAHKVLPQRFKIDVTEFWSPRLSSTLQLVLSVRNSNLFSSMLLEECAVTVFEAATGQKLGVAKHGRLHVEPRQTMQVNLALVQAGSGLPPPQQRRLAEVFLRHKALLLTIVATATSKIPLKTAKSSQVSANSSKWVDLSKLLKDPFYSRAPPPPQEEKAEPAVYDVPI